MTIDFSITEYFEQLQLMEQQYGQEEDLYPWIYMLLQMVESRKKKEFLDYKGISIRDIHSWKKKHAPLKMEEGVRKRILDKISSENKEKKPNGGAPEFLIMDIDTEWYFGCVEIKVFNDPRWTSLNPCEHNELKCNTYTIKERESHTSKFNLGEKINEIKNKLNATRRVIRVRHRKCQKVHCFYIDVVAHEGEKSSELMYYEYEQLLMHIKRFKKVLYTDGLEFYLLSEKEGKIYIEEIANLKNAYHEYKRKNGEKIFNDEWELLIEKLEKIKWNEMPVEKI